MRWCCANGKIALAGNAWLSLLLRYQHHMIVRTIDDQGRRGGWVMPLIEVPGSCALAWPMVEHSFPGRPRSKYFVFGPAPIDINSLYIPVVDLDLFEAFPFTWRSPLWLARQSPRMPLEILTGAGVVVEPCGPVEPLLTVACRMGLFNLGLATVSLLAKHLGIDLPAKKTLFDVLFRVVSEVLKLPDSEVMAVLARRLGAEQMDGMTALLELDEAYEVLDRDERDACDQMKAQHESARGDAVAFKRAWNEKRDLVLAEPGQGKGRRSRGKPKAAPKPQTLPPGDLAQANLAPLCPQGGFIWKNNSMSGGWQAHFPPYKRVSFAGTLYGKRRSAILCLRYLWEAARASNGDCVVTCPIDRLWSDAICEDSTELGGGSASSSSSA